MQNTLIRNINCEPIILLISYFRFQLLDSLVTIMFWLIYDYCYLNFRFAGVLGSWFFNDVILRREQKQVWIEELLNPTIMGQYINEEVAAVEHDKLGVSKGAGGLGTDRAALNILLKNGRTIHAFVKTPTKSFFINAFFTVFQIYDNEMRFYVNHLKHLKECLDKPNDEKWSVGPILYHGR